LRRAGAALGLLLLLAGCEGQRRRWAAEKAVRAYCEAVSEAYRLSDAARLLPVASRQEVGRVQVLIELKLAAKLVLESRLDSFEVLESRPVGADGMLVRTRERWRYHDRATEPGRPVGPVFVADMEMEWDLAREDGAWKVEKGRTLKSDYLEPKGYRPGPPQGHGAPADASPQPGEGPK
jgi:hypothetical protein